MSAHTGTCLRDICGLVVIIISMVTLPQIDACLCTVLCVHNCDTDIVSFCAGCMPTQDRGMCSCLSQFPGRVSLLRYRWLRYSNGSGTVVAGCLRSHYKCTAQSCLVRKRVEARRSSDDQLVTTWTYEGMHNHPPEAELVSNV